MREHTLPLLEKIEKLNKTCVNTLSPASLQIASQSLSLLQSILARIKVSIYHANSFAATFLPLFLRAATTTTTKERVNARDRSYQDDLGIWEKGMKLLFPNWCISCRRFYVAIYPYLSRSCGPTIVLFLTKQKRNLLLLSSKTGRRKPCSGSSIDWCRFVMKNCFVDCIQLARSNQDFFPPLDRHGFF